MDHNPPNTSYKVLSHTPSATSTRVPAPQVKRYMNTKGRTPIWFCHDFFTDTISTRREKRAHDDGAQPLPFHFVGAYNVKYHSSSLDPDLALCCSVSYAGGSRDTKLYHCVLSSETESEILAEAMIKTYVPDSQANEE